MGGIGTIDIKVAAAHPHFVAQWVILEGLGSLAGFKPTHQGSRINVKDIHQTRATGFGGPDVLLPVRNDIGETTVSPPLLGGGFILADDIARDMAVFFASIRTPDENTRASKGPHGVPDELGVLSMELVNRELANGC